MSPKRRGRPPKKHRSLAGLHNNSSSSTIPSAASSSQAHQPVDDVTIARSQGLDRLPVRHKKDEASSEAEDSGDESDMEDYAESNWDELDDEDFAKRLAEMAMQDDPNNLDWVPPKWRGKQTAKKKGKTYLVLSLDHRLIIEVIQRFINRSWRFMSAYRWLIEKV